MSNISGLRRTLKGLPVAPVARHAKVARSTVRALRDETTANPGVLTIKRIRQAAKVVRRRMRKVGKK